MKTLVDKFKSVGVKAESYKRGPLGKDAFSLSIQKDALKIWEGSADVKVRTNKRKRQCLFTVVENSREIKGSCQFVYYVKMDTPVGNVKDLSEKNIKSLIDDKVFGIRSYRSPKRTDSNVVVPNSRMSYRIKAARVTQDLYEDRYHNKKTNKEEKVALKRMTVLYDLIFKTRKTTTTFLAGYDESTSERPFICMLKDNVDTFEEAYQNLLPVGVELDLKCKRQGEWFLNPVSDKLNTAIAKHAVLNPRSFGTMRLNGVKKGKWEYPWGRVLSSHEATCVRYDGKLYAIGEVKDVRNGRHEPIELDSFHEVIRNNEAVQPETARNSTRRNWD